MHLMDGTGGHLQPHPGGPGGRRRLAWVLVAALIAVAMTVAFGSFAFRQVEPVEKAVAVATAVRRIVVPSPESLFGKPRISLLVVGVDDNWTKQDIIYTKNDRSDTIMAVALDFPTHRVSVVSVPRDMWVHLPNGQGDAKINAAFTNGGPQESEEVVAKFLGVPSFDRYVVLKINATKELIDAIGGIDICVEKPMHYDDDWGRLHIHLKQGCQHLTGEQAVGYVRFRHDATGDIARIERQQRVVRIIMQKLKNEKFNDLTHIAELIGVVRRNVETNLTFNEMRSLAFAFRNVDAKAVQTAQVPAAADVTEPDGEEALEVDAQGRDRVVRRLLTGPVAPRPVAPVAPRAHRVAVKATPAAMR